MFLGDLLLSSVIWHLVFSSFVHCLLLSTLGSRHIFFFLMIRRPPRSTRTDTLFPYTTLFRSRPASAKRGGMAASTVSAMAAVESWVVRSEEHTSELQSLMRISYAVFCLKKKKHIKRINIQTKKRRRKVDGKSEQYKSEIENKKYTTRL